MKIVTAALLIGTLATTVACSDGSDNSIDLTPLLERYVLSSEDSVPEGVAFDSQERAFYATSLQGGSIVRFAAGGTETYFREADNRATLGGVKIDAERRRLWVCANEVDGIDDRIWVFDLGSGQPSGQPSMEFFLGALSTNGSCNDLALDRAGIAYVTDPANPFIYRLDAATGEGSVLASDSLFDDVTAFGLGLNGIAVTADESALIVAKFAPPGLLRVSLPAGETITPIVLSGDVFPAPDGLAFLDEDLYSVSGNSVNRVRFNAGYTEGDVVTSAQISGLSTGTVAERELYVIKSEVTNFTFGFTLDTPFEIFRVDRGDFEQEP